MGQSAGLLGVSVEVTNGQFAHPGVGYRRFQRGHGRRVSTTGTRTSSVSPRGAAAISARANSRAWALLNAVTHSSDRPGTSEAVAVLTWCYVANEHAAPNRGDRVCAVRL